MQNMKYEDLEERTFRFAVEVIKLVNKLPRNSGNQVIGNQEIKAVTSVNSNVVQGRAGVSKKDFINHYKIARKEAKESHRWLEMLKATNNVFQEEFEKLIKENIEIIKILVSCIKTAIKNEEKKN